MNSQLRTPWEKVVAVFPGENFSLELKWEDGHRTRLFLQPRIKERDIFWRLRNPRYFRRVSVDPLGGVCWPEGEDLSPNYLAQHSSPKLPNAKTLKAMKELEENKGKSFKTVDELFEDLES